MSREWKPGTLIANDEGDRYWLVEVTANTEAAASSGRAWQPGSSAVDADGNGWRLQSIEGAHALVVLDPESVADRNRLLFALEQTRFNLRDEPNIKEALRSLLTPPKPDEPQGLGAVVEDAGRRWTHFGNGCWIAAVPNAQLDQQSWEAFSTAVRVLSEGWSE